MTQAAWTERYAGALMHTFGAPKRVFVRGEGTSVWDADGNEYTDLLSGLAVNGLGHAHPRVTAAITDQLHTLGHVSNFFATPQQIELAEKLDAFATGGREGAHARVFFTNSGTEANEAALKITRLTGRTKIIAVEGSFHGRTMGSLAITHTAKYREPFEPLPGDVTFVPYGDVDALRAAVDDTVAAVVLEVVQGENGVIEAPEGYVAAARELTRAHGALLWIDEVQTGMGRCGDWFAHTALGVDPDLITLAKGLANGFPIGACLAVGDAAELLTPGAHGSTFGGNPVAAAAALAVIDVIESDDLLARSRELGEWFATAVMALGHPGITKVSGRGLLRGVHLTADIAPQVGDAMLARGFIINAPRPHILRVAPPLIVAQESLEAFIAALAEVLTEVGGGND